MQVWLKASQLNKILKSPMQSREEISYLHSGGGWTDGPGQPMVCAVHNRCSLHHGPVQSWPTNSEVPLALDPTHITM